MKIRPVDLIPHRTRILVLQGHKCALCGVSFKEQTIRKRKRVNKYVACLDHDHTDGHLRGVLCANCNRSEGRVKNASVACQRNGHPIDWLRSLVAYLEKHTSEPSVFIHPQHKTDDEKRLARNATARRKRAQANALAALAVAASKE